jgi:hypothetical protein
MSCPVHGRLAQRAPAALEGRWHSRHRLRRRADRAPRAGDRALAALEGSPALQEALLAPLRRMTELQARPAGPDCRVAPACVTELTS